MTLTRRQAEVLELLANEGLSRVDIAERLGCTPNTVRTHVNAIMRRTGTRSALGAVVWAWHHGEIRYSDAGRIVEVPA